MLLGARQFFAARKAATLDISEMTQLEITTDSQHLTYAVRKGVLASGSDSVRIYWDALGDPNDYTDYAGGFVDATHTYSEVGDFVVAITNDISSLSITGASGSPAFLANQNMLRRITTGLKVTTLPSSGGGADEAMRFVRNAQRLQYVNLRNVTSAIRPLWGVAPASGGTCYMDKVSFISTYGLEYLNGWDLYCDALSNMQSTTGGQSQNVKLHYRTKTCADVLAYGSGLLQGARDSWMIYCTDGYIHYDGSAWVAVTSS